MLNQKTPQSLRSASFQGRGDIVVPQRAARLNQIKQSAKVSAPDQHLDAIGFVRPISDITPKTPVVHDVTPKVCTPSVMDIAPQYKKTASTATGSPQYTRPVVQYSRPHVVRSGRVISDIGSIKQPSTISQSNATASVAVQQFAKDKSVASNFDTSSHIKPVYEPTAQKVQRLSFFRMLRYIVPVAVMLVGGFLTYDTWVTNRAVEVRASAFPSVKAEPQESTEAAATSSDDDAKQENKARNVPASVPASIQIDSIGVSAPIIQVGVTSQGAIDAPLDNVHAGWYNKSAKPGGTGSVFIDGHYGTRTDKGVFHNLSNTKSGQEIKIKNGAGQEFKYRIVSVKTLPVDQVDMAEALRPARISRQSLTIITCAGQYNIGNNSYNQRTIVYAEYIQ